eukprot:gene13217-27961_t
MVHSNLCFGLFNLIIIFRSKALADSTWRSINHGIVLEGLENRTRFSTYKKNETNSVLFNGVKKVLIRPAVGASETDDHSCFDYRVMPLDVTDPLEFATSGTFCYPKFIVAGVGKCGTSAFFTLLQMHPRTMMNNDGIKEHCPFNSEMEISSYFSHFPKYVPKGDFLIDSCIDLWGDMTLHQLFFHPKTNYIVLVRDFADYLWSAYNFWCDKDYDIQCQSNDNWVDPSKHNRSAAHFEEMIVALTNGIDVRGPQRIKDDYRNAGSFYKEYISYLWLFTDPINTVIVAKEAFVENPELQWSKIPILGQYPHPRIDQFKKLRANSNDNTTRSGSQSKRLTQMTENTRNHLNKAWRPDCLWSETVTGYDFSAC